MLFEVCRHTHTHTQTHTHTHTHTHSHIHTHIHTHKKTHTHTETHTHSHIRTHTHTHIHTHTHTHTYTQRECLCVPEISAKSDLVCNTTSHSPPLRERGGEGEGTSMNGTLGGVAQVPIGARSNPTATDPLNRPSFIGRYSSVCKHNDTSHTHPITFHCNSYVVDYSSMTHTHTHTHTHLHVHVHVLRLIG